MENWLNWKFSKKIWKIYRDSTNFDKFKRMRIISHQKAPKIPKIRSFETPKKVLNFKKFEKWDQKEMNAVLNNHQNQKPKAEFQSHKKSIIR